MCVVVSSTYIVAVYAVRTASGAEAPEDYREGGEEGEPAAAAASPAASATDVRVEIPVLSSRTDIPKGAELLLYEKAVVRAKSPRRIPIGTLMRAKRPSTSASA